MRRNPTHFRTIEQWIYPAGNGSSAGVSVSISIGARRSKNSSIGFSLGTETGITVAASAGKGHGSGQETVYSNTRIEAGEQVRIDSGGNTTLRGAVVAAPQVKARIRGDLLIESLQDTSVFQEESQQVGGSVTFGPAPGASVSASRTKIDSNLASVGEQSAIRAGDGGFDVQVKGATDLKGGAITSTQVAVNNDGKTNEATKNLREPLQKGQTNPKDARQQQQQEKPQKKTGKGMKM